MACSEVFEFFTYIAGAAFIISCPFALLFRVMEESHDKDREFQERRDKRRDEQQERDSIRRNFDLQRARMPNIGTEELIAFSQAAMAEVRKRQEAAMARDVTEELWLAANPTAAGEEEEKGRQLTHGHAMIRARAPNAPPTSGEDVGVRIVKDWERVAAADAATREELRREYSRKMELQARIMEWRRHANALSAADSGNLDSTEDFAGAGAEIQEDKKQATRQRVSPTIMLTPEEFKPEPEGFCVPQ